MLTDSDKRSLLAMARSAVASEIGLEAPEPGPLSPETERLRAAAFVTLLTRGRLRGCLGQTAPRGPLREDIAHLARAAASSDPRFRPLQRGEFRDLTVEISILGPLEPIRSIAEIEIGKHGLYVVGQGRSGLLLAKVASQYGWDRETFLAQTLAKAGLAPDAPHDLFRFEELSFSENDFRL